VSITMWSSRILRLLLIGQPEFLLLGTEPGDAAFSGRYIRLDGHPLAIGQMIGQGDEALVFELISLRHGSCAHVLKICRYRPGTARYERWAVPTRDELSPYAEVPDIERHPARLEEVSGGVVKVQPFITSDPATSWRAFSPAQPIYRAIQQYGLETAMSLADRLLEKHGQRGVLLQARALCLWQMGRIAEAERAYEVAIEALTIERNAARLRATCEMAAVQSEIYRSLSSREAELSLELPGGLLHRQVFFTNPEEAGADDTLQDRPVMRLLEALAEEPYLVRALVPLAFIIADAPAAGSAMWALVRAIEWIDPDCEALPELRSLAQVLHPVSQKVGHVGDQRAGREPELDPDLTFFDETGFVARHERAYRPEPTRGQQARGRFLAAEMHLEAGHLDDAERELRAAIKLDAATLEYPMALVDMLSRSDRLDDARKLAEETVMRFPSEPASYERLGDVLRLCGESKDAKLAYLRALRVEPSERWEIELKLGETYRELGDLGRALSFFRMSHDQAPDEPMTAVELAQALRAGSLNAEHPNEDPAFQEAFDILDSALTRNPDSAELLVCIAQSLVALGRPNDAIASLRRAVDSDPRNPFARGFLESLEDWRNSDFGKN
jgi:tetratricopeptide (TPR) repeat protein